MHFILVNMYCVHIIRYVLRIVNVYFTKYECWSWKSTSNWEVNGLKGP